jgi:hypothetical protein
MLTAAVERGVEYLAAVQLPGGEFPSFARSGPSVDAPGTLDPSPFVTTFVLYALALADSPAARPLMERGTRFLLDVQDEGGLWRYWPPNGPRRIDADLDDTCCASFVLRWLGTPGFAPPNEAAILANRSPAGLFRTWVRRPELKNDLDSVVNANVLLYLGERPETIAARDLLVQAINRGIEESTYYYYLDPLALYYMVSRAYVHGVRGLEGCREAVLRKTLPRRTGEGTLASALALCTLCNFGLSGSPEVLEGARALAGAQLPDGSWGDHLFYAGPEPPSPHTFWWSSPALTAALCIEALSKTG